MPETNTAPAARGLARLFIRKSVEQMHAEHASSTLKRSLGALNLVSLGIGCVIGTGIFVLTGRAAAEYAGPAIILSFIITGLLCTLVALCYAELAAMLPVSGTPGEPDAVQAWLWAAILGGSLFAMLALSRAGSTLFWKVDGSVATDARAAGWRDTLPLGVALVAILAITVLAAPMQRYAQATARDLLAPAPLIEQMLRTAPRPGPHQPAPETFR
jgi:amino acid transporter